MTISARQLLRRITFAPLLFIAALILLFEEFAWEPIQAAVAWFSRFRIVARVEAWVASLPSWGIFVMFVVPAAALLPVKLLAVWLLTTGHTVAGIAVLLSAKVLGTAIAARLFTLGRDKLLTIMLFRRGYELVLSLHEQVHAALERVPGWVALKMALRALKERIGQMRAGLRRRGWLALRLGAAKSWLRRRARARG